jgi:hypothetical protein
MEVDRAARASASWLQDLPPSSDAMPRLPPPGGWPLAYRIDGSVGCAVKPMKSWTGDSRVAEPSGATA